MSQAARLLIALDDLVEREATFLRGGYYDLAAETRERAEPLAQQLYPAGRPAGPRDLSGQGRGTPGPQRGERRADQRQDHRLGGRAASH